MRWIRYLDGDDRTECIQEMWEALENNPGHLRDIVEAFRITAVTLSDPQRREILTGDLMAADCREVGRPSQARDSYSPVEPVARPAGRPDCNPVFSVLVHRKFSRMWKPLPDRVGTESTRQFYDHVADRPVSPPEVNSTCHWRGRAGLPQCEGGSRTIHHESGDAGRVDFPYVNSFSEGARRGAHPVVFILTIDLSRRSLACVPKQSAFLSPCSRPPGADSGDRSGGGRRRLDTGQPADPQTHLSGFYAVGGMTSVGAPRGGGFGEGQLT
jgi:hypothetical protein